MFIIIISHNMQMLMNVKIMEQTLAIMECAKIPMDPMTAFVHLDISWIQVEFVVLVGSNSHSYNFNLYEYYVNFRS